MKANKPVVSVILLSYNGEKYIKSCLDSVFGQTYPDLEVLVIDNGSTDTTKDFLRNLPKRPNLRIILNKENVGFTKGHNQGIKESRGDFILCLNQDIFLDRDFISRAVEIFKKNNRIGAVQGKLLRWNTANSNPAQVKDYQISHIIIDTTGLVILKNRRIVNRGQGQVDQGQFKKIEEIFGPDGAAPVYRKEALNDVKVILKSKNREEYFDEDFFAYKEDVDLAWRLRLYGWKTFYQPKSIAWHDRTAGDSAARNYFGIVKERLKISKFAKYLAFKNQRLMQLKNEQLKSFLKHLPWFLPKEAASWIYVLLFERYTYKAIKDLFKQIPLAWQKRKIIMANKAKLRKGDMERWFN
jgi:GT2 family glycosyltransferase